MVDINAIRLLISTYKVKFDQISQKEIYKWAAVKLFQDRWDPTNENFKKMILGALDGVNVLMDTHQYYPKRMLSFFMDVEPQKVRQLFNLLFDETLPLLSRMQAFEDGMSTIRDRHFAKKIHFQDPRAMILYLSLRYPEIYFLYKYEMLKEFASLVGYPSRINKRQKYQNVETYYSIAEIVRQEVLQDNELIKMHHGRLSNNHYADTSYRLLTQDIIYAASEGLLGKTILDEQFDIDVLEGNIDAIESTPILRGRHVDHQEKAALQKCIGDLGEQAVLIFEKKKLFQKFKGKKVPDHVSKSLGDGLGYDIGSFDLKDGKPIFIEVKTTQSLNSPFYITGPELAKSLEAGPRYYLYRLFDFDQVKRKCKMTIHQGSLEEFCINPVVYYVPYNFTGSQDQASSKNVSFQE